MKRFIRPDSKVVAVVALDYPDAPEPGGEAHWSVYMLYSGKHILVADGSSVNLREARDIAEDTARGVLEEPEQVFTAKEFGRTLGASEEEMEELKQEFGEGEER